MSTKLGPCAFCVADEYGHICTGACDECEGTGVAPPSDYDQGYKDGWDAAILQVVKKQLDNF